MSTDTVYVFGSFRLLPARRALLCDERPVKLGARALDMLLVLVERCNRVVTKNELLELVWPGLVVEENNLQVQVVTLRRLLGHPAITTVPGRGYRFTLPVRREGEPAGPAPVPEPPAPPRAIDSALIGREEDLRALLELLAGQHLVTVTGPAGIGKTTLAVAAARRLAEENGGGGSWWVELASLSDAALVAPTVARALGVTADGPAGAMRAIAEALRGRTGLLVLDNAEHLLDSVASVVAAIRQQAPSASMLVTSQEVLRVGDEHVYRLAPLGLPAAHDLASASASGAVALFAARARAASAGFVLNGANAATVIDICGRLDGIPLAIELAAARVPLLGVEGLRTRLDERFRLLTAGSRAALRRHQTLRAALEWSHGLLTAREQALFRRLGTFVGSFTLEAAQALAEDEEMDRWSVLDHLGSLVDKSLLLVEGDAIPRYRMLDSTRLYALEQLSAAQETASYARRHAKALVAVMPAVQETARRWNVTRQQFEADAALIHNARAAIEWATGSGKSHEALEIVSCALSPFLRADLVNEYVERARRVRHHADHESVAAGVAAGYWLAVARTGSKAAGPFAAEAAARAVGFYRSNGPPELLYEALASTVLIGVHRADGSALEPVIAEAIALEQEGWPLLLRSFFRWSRTSWLQSQGRYEDALQSALEQAGLVPDPVLAHRLAGAIVVDCELALGRFEAAELRVRAMLGQLSDAGADDKVTGPLHGGLMVAVIMQGRYDEARSIALEARRRLRLDSDDLRLLEPLALRAARLGRHAEAARVVGHVDAALQVQHTTRWPAVLQRRSMLDRVLAQALEPAALGRCLADGRSLSRDEAFALALD
jgi:predicted ATPase/DNA-binding winged helix-turn-helix (wHTH) protein